MFGHYIWNNVSIGFRTFASGLLAGVGAIVVLIVNGVMIGGVAGHLQAVGHGDPFWRFVAGHSAPELTAIVIAGGAGLRLGLNLIAPGQRRRIDALVEGGRRGALLCLGVLAMLVFAAFVEAFWSSIAWMPACDQVHASAACCGRLTFAVAVARADASVRRRDATGRMRCAMRSRPDRRPAPAHRVGSGRAGHRAGAPPCRGDLEAVAGR